MFALVSGGAGKTAILLIADRSVNSFKIYESLLHIGENQLHSNPVAHIYAFISLYKFSFNRRIENTDPRALKGSTSNNRIESFTDS